VLQRLVNVDLNFVYFGLDFLVLLQQLFTLVPLVVLVLLQIQVQTFDFQLLLLQIFDVVLVFLFDCVDFVKFQLDVFEFTVVQLYELTCVPIVALQDLTVFLEFTDLLFGFTQLEVL